jgi:hypothetical protein
MGTIIMRRVMKNPAVLHHRTRNTALMNTPYFALSDYSETGRA